MSSFNIKSRVITNRDATPVALTDATLAKGMLQEAFGIEQIPTTADVGSQVRLISVPSSVRLSAFEYFAAQLGTSSLDVAAWFPTNTSRANSGVVAAALISSSAFATAIAGVDAGIVETSAFGTISVTSVPERALMLWQQLGLAADPNIDIDLGFTVRTTNSIAGYVGLRARYVR
jgi:hypothetical protein